MNKFNLKKERKKFVDFVLRSNIDERLTEKIINMIQEQDDEFLRRLKEEPEDFDYKVINRVETMRDAWGKLIKPMLKYSWRDIEYAIKLKIEQIKKLAGEI